MKPQNKKVNDPKLTSDQFELELDLPKTLRTEFNFLKFPFFDLARDSKREKIKIEERIDTKEGKFRILWLVTRNVVGQFPGDFEKRLHRSIEQIINAHPKPLDNPLRLGSLRYIAKLMGINPDSGKNREDIQRAFENIVTASIKAEGTFQLKEANSKRYIKDTFHLYDRVIFKGEELPDGKTADCIYLMLGSWYLSNINSNYVVPLDWEFYNQLSGSISTRMYEYLSIYFYATMERGYDYHDILYSQLCNYFPIKRQYPRWKARGQLKKAHEILIKSEYFKQVEWLETTEAKDWLLRYWIGEKAREEYERNKKEIRHFGLATPKPVLIPERRRRQNNEQIPALSTNPDHLETIKALVARGISQGVARQLAVEYSAAYIASKVEVFDFMKKNKSRLLMENPPGFLRQSIKDDYQPPSGFISEAQEKVQKEAAVALKHQVQEAARKKAAEEEEWHRRLEIFYESLPQHQQIQIHKQALERTLNLEHVRDIFKRVEKSGEDPLERSTIRAIYLDYRNEILQENYPELSD